MEGYTMFNPISYDTKSRFLAALALTLAFALPACSINVKKAEDGQDKKVDIQTPVGGIHVSKDADARDMGLEVYPGARAKKENGDGEEKNANVNISSGLFGIKVVAIEFESDDAADKLIAFYRDRLKKFGKVLECHTDSEGKDVNINTGKDHDSQELTCSEDSGRNTELKVGTKNNQHLVSIKPRSKGCDFALVYVQARGKDTI
jgi:hypothetical protein